METLVARTSPLVQLKTVLGDRSQMGLGRGSRSVFGHHFTQKVDFTAQ